MKKNNLSFLFVVLLLSVFANGWADTYAIVACYNGGSNSCYKAMTSTASSTSGKLDAMNVIVLNNKVYCSDNDRASIEWTSATTNNGRYFQPVNTSKYLSCSSSASLSLSTMYDKWTIKDERINISNYSSNCIMYYNPNSCFGVYAPTTKNYPASLYEFATSSDNTYTRSGLTIGNYGTICLPFDVSTTSNSGATFYTISGKVLDSNSSPTQLIFEKVTTLTAGMPYLFMAEQESFTLTFDTSKSATSTATVGTYGLRGTYSEESVASGDYVVSGNKIVKCGTGCTIGANRAYIKMDIVPEYSDPLPAKALVFDLIDTTTGIDGITMENTQLPAYNLSGQRVDRNTKGILIINGKKYVNR